MTLIFACDSTNKSGIINYFNARKTVEKELKVVALSSLRGFPAKNLVQENTFYYHSLRKPVNESLWAIITFKRGTMKINKYAITASRNNAVYLINWIISGSLNGEDWDLIDSQENVNFLAKNDAKGSFSCKEGVYKYIKITPTGSNVNHIVLGQVEFFGTFTYDQDAFLTCKCRKNTSILSKICSIFLLS